MAILSHDAWRFSRNQTDSRIDESTDQAVPIFESRFKPTTDTDWITANRQALIGQGLARKVRTGGLRWALEVDIANLDHSSLPRDHQKDTEASAREVLGYFYRLAFFHPGSHGGVKDPLPVGGYVTEANIILHQKWIDRHPEASPHQKLQFDSLSQAEKLKDMAIVRAGANIVGERIASGTFDVPQEMVAEWAIEEAKFLRSVGRQGVRGWLLPPSDSQRALSGWRVSRARVKDVDGGDGRVRLQLNIPRDGINFDNNYPLEAVARALWAIRNSVPDSRDWRSVAHDEQARRAVYAALQASLTGV